MVNSHASLFVQTGKKKGLLVTEPMNADFAARMLLTGGTPFWTGPEALPFMDYLFASGKASCQQG